MYIKRLKLKLSFLELLTGIALSPLTIWIGNHYIANGWGYPLPLKILATIYVLPELMLSMAIGIFTGSWHIDQGGSVDYAIGVLIASIYNTRISLPSATLEGAV